MRKIPNNIYHLPQGVKASFAFFIANVITSGISYITTPIYTRLLTTDEFGQTSVFLTWLRIFGIVAMFCLSYGVFNNGMLDYKDDRDQYSFSMLILSNIITVIFAVVLFILYPFIGNMLDINIPLLILMIVVFLTQPAYDFWLARQRYEYKYKASVLFTILTTFLSSILAIVCIIITHGNKFYARIFGGEITLILFYILFYINLAKKSNFKIKTSYWKSAFLFNLPLIPHYISSYVLSSSDKIMISHLISDTATAYYSLAHSVAAAVLIIWSAANASLTPYTYEKCKEKNLQAISKVTMPILVLFAVACLFIILLAPEVVAVMATKDYKEAIYVIPPIVGSVFFQVQYYMYANLLYYLKKPKFVMYASVTAALLNIILNYIFIPRFGYIAAGYTTIVCNLLQAIIDYIAMRKIIGQSIYNMRFVGGLSAAIIIISVFSNLIYNHNTIRYCAMAIIILLAVIFRKKILIMFSILKKEDSTHGNWIF